MTELLQTRPSTTAAMLALFADDAATGHALAFEAALAGTLVFPLVARLRAALTGEAAVCVHKGATSQDVADTVFILQAHAASVLVLADLDRVTAALRELAERHAERRRSGEPSCRMRCR